MDAIVALSPAREAWPITEAAPVLLDQGERDAIGSLARRLRHDEPALGAWTALAPDAQAGYDPRLPRLVYEDHQAIELIEQSITPAHAYRFLGLAGDGDIALIPAPRAPRFEAYLAEDLGLGAPQVVEVDLRGLDPAPASLARVFRNDPTAHARVAEVARNAGGLNIAPYLVDGHAWLLAQSIATAAGVPILVAGPPPRLTRRANDKLWFTNRVVELLGRNAAPPTFATFGPNAAAARIAAITRRGGTAVIKAPASAAGKGNLAWKPEDVGDSSIAQIATQLVLWMTGVGLDARRPLLIGVWETGVTASPSAQVWIPPERDQLPIVEGLFLQEVAGSKGVFIGAQPADLPPQLDRKMRREATMLARLFQELGYVGRCCFDAVIVARDDGEGQIHWIECNARWSGVSVPMTLVNRLTGDWRRTPFVVAYRSDLMAPPGGFEALLDLWSDLLFRPQGVPRGCVLIGPTSEAPGVRFVAMGATVVEAQEIASTAVGRLSGPAP